MHISFFHHIITSSWQLNQKQLKIAVTTVAGIIERHVFKNISLEAMTTLADPIIDRDATLTRINNMSLDNLGDYNFIVNVPDEDYYVVRQVNTVQARRRDRRRER
ncbi:PREDICTED: uncharacterized protein LOC109174608 [Ipomoea nil]|uniref:uncharacterized protein LOC109174608 n=1 Tax=Ipomoea nil TaxID=35883 RepID=UPI0009018260|nr:PREDICTED: uncharacterized protein LOC109174608 [Ipomoea nil]